MGEAFIVSAVRTAGGRKGGRLKDWHPADLAAQSLNAIVDRNDFDPAIIDDVVLGCVGTAGQQAHNIARNAILSSKLPDVVPGTTVDRQCGSSQQAIHFAAQGVMSGTQDIVVAAGVESMTRVPMGMAGRFPEQHGFGKPWSPTIEKRFEGIEVTQFRGAEILAERYGLSRDDLDAFAFASQQRAIAATQGGLFRDEIVPVEIETENGREMHIVDEGIRFDTSLAAISAVKLLREGGVVTAANSSQICDGSSAVLIMNERGLQRTGLTPIGRIVHMSVMGSDPTSMLETPIPATKRALERAGMSIDDIDLYEVNEAFASMPLAWLKAIGADPERINVHGGAIAIGHPLGSSGTKLMGTLLHALKNRGKRLGLQTMCEAGGLANVTIVERL